MSSETKTQPVRRVRTDPAPAPGAGSDSFLRDVTEGLTRTPKRLPSKYFYDRRGSELFDRICELDEYYLTRTELKIMADHAADMATRLGPHCLLIEPGSGSSLKTRALLAHLPRLAAYVPVDISNEYMNQWAELLGEDFPELRVLPVHADFCERFPLPDVPGARRRAIYFPGSTIGNLTRVEAAAWLGRMSALVGEGGALLIGVDLEKDAAMLEAAYNDRDGVTRAFNLNLLSRIRRELDADVRIDQFEHRAFYNDAQGRIEMHLVSTVRQTVCLDHTEIQLEAGETIHTENSYKYGLEEFRRLAAAAGWTRADYWTDEREWFSVQYFEVSDEGV